MDSRPGTFSIGSVGTPLDLTAQVTSLTVEFSEEVEDSVPTLSGETLEGAATYPATLTGTLVQDLPSQRPSEVTHDAPDSRASRVHAVRVDPGSALAGALGSTTLTVNSSHHQAVERLGDSLRITAHAPDGIPDPAALHARLKALVGVVETGLFIGMATRVIVGTPDGPRVLERA